MKVRAKNWICHNGTWHKSGEEFEISRDDAELISESVEIVETPLTWDEPNEESVAEAKPRSRRKKTEN